VLGNFSMTRKFRRQGAAFSETRHYDRDGVEVLGSMETIAPGRRNSDRATPILPMASTRPISAPRSSNKSASATAAWSIVEFKPTTILTWI